MKSTWSLLNAKERRHIRALFAERPLSPTQKILAAETYAQFTRASAGEVVAALGIALGVLSWDWMRTVAPADEPHPWTTERYDPMDTLAREHLFQIAGERLTAEGKVNLVEVLSVLGNMLWHHGHQIAEGKTNGEAEAAANAEVPA